jgi:two-component system phosphate regulon response regulator PhoB
MAKKILLIDDDPLVVKSLRRCLELRKFEVITALSGEEGIKSAVKAKPDLILLDILMPRMDGKEVLRQLKKNPASAKIPVVMLTVSSEAEDVVEALTKGGAVDYIVKTSVFENAIFQTQGDICDVKIEGVKNALNDIEEKVEKYIK